MKYLNLLIAASSTICATALAIWGYQGGLPAWIGGIGWTVLAFYNFTCLLLVITLTINSEEKRNK